MGWEVIGGGDKGGILIREGPTPGSKQLQRLATGATVEELELRGDKLHFKRITGEGPDEGWATIKLPDKDLLVRIEPDEPSVPLGEPVEPVDIAARCAAEWDKPPVR